jgi:hypothetical protein
MPTDTDFARLAAYIDGEGSININKFGNYDCVRLDVFNTDPRLIVWLKRTFGGGATYREFPNEHQRFPKYSWYIGAQKCCDLLEKCMPYFVIKREEAELVIAFQATKKYHRWNPLPAGMLDHRTGMKKKLQLMHNTRLTMEELPEDEQIKDIAGNFGRDGRDKRRA